MVGEMSVNNIKTLLEQQLQKELERHQDPTRAAEGLYALCMDLQLERRLVLASLEQIQPSESIEATKRLFLENENFEVLTRERLLARRVSPRPSATELARDGDLEGLRRVTGKDLQMALRSVDVKAASQIIVAWNALSVYEQTR